MELTFEKTIAAAPEAVWPYVCDPTLMNLWSTAKIRLVAPGEDLCAWSVGSARQVVIRAFGHTRVLDEVIEHAEPPHRLVYRVVGGMPVRDHRGEQVLEETGGGTRLMWRVRVDFLMPWMAAPARKILTPQLRQSLDALALVAGGAEASGGLARSVFLDDTEGLEGLYRDAEATLSAQRSLAARLGEAGDFKRWFARVYALVTEHQLKACRAGRFTHTAWVLRLIPRFHHHFARNLRLWESADGGWAEQHWCAAFRAMEEAPQRHRQPMEAIGHAIARGMRAHIDEDLPRALAQVYAGHYHGRCAYARMRADYLLMEPVFAAASQSLFETIPTGALTLRARLWRGVLPAPLFTHLMRHSGLTRQRRRAFERGHRLAMMLV